MPDKSQSIEQLKIVFLGTPDFACPILRELANDARFQVLAVITQEDKKTGRKQILTPPPVKTLANELKIEVYQPIKLNKDKQLIEKLNNLKPDFLVVVAYGQILSQNILNIPKIAPINIHGSILPKYRGASPIETCLLNGDKTAGISIMKMVLEMDAGPYYTQYWLNIDPQDNNVTLRDKLSKLASQKLPDDLIKIAKVDIIPTAQEPRNISFSHKIIKEDGLVDATILTASEIYNRFRAYYSWPGIYLKVKGKNLKLLEILPVDNREIDEFNLNAQPGLFQTNASNIYLGTAKGLIKISKLQLEGKNPLNTFEFLAGNRQLLLP